MKLERSIHKLKIGEPLKISALGDSLTHGFMVQNGYIDFLDDMLKEKYPESDLVIENMGIPGDTSENGLKRLKKDVLDSKPDLVFIQFALNDAYVGCSSERFQNNIISMVDNINSNLDADILLLTSTCASNEQGNRVAEEFYSRLEEVSEKKKLPIARLHEYWKKKIDEGMDYRDLVQFDMIHPTDEGYRLIAEAIMEVF
ncbi:MAG: hypothetical protein GY754_31445 [bacterium]|nr:hypothetical protein [bacterium]